VYVNKKPGTPLDPLTLEFLRFVLSKEGQEVVVKDGYYPLPKEAVDETLEALSN
jgi:phosphate transport system substrate-binding protein